MGVRRAVELAAAEAKQAASGGNPVFTLGPLIHNPIVLDDLKSLGVNIIEESPFTANCSVIIRAHGISPAAERNLRGKGCRIVDATCPKVKTSQLKTQELSRAGYCLFLAGEANKQGRQHAEIAGILGYAEDASFCAVVTGADEAEKTAAALFHANPDAKTALLGQTTISEEEYRIIGDAIKIYFPNLEIEQTICAATTERQQALRELLSCSDAVIVAGAKESANTSRLFAIAQESGKPCVLAENPDNIPSSFHKYKTIGLCAGASAPDSLVNEIEMSLLSI